MAFNVLKCKILHTGRTNPKYKYSVGGSQIQVTERECDIGVNITANLKPTVHCNDMARKATGVLGQLSRAFHYRDRKVFKKLYLQQVRPLLEFSSPVWSPWTNEDIETLENVQKKFVRMVSGLQGTTYEERLAELEILSLKNRRLQLDLTQVFKIVHGIDRVDSRTWFELVGQQPNTNTRLTSHPYNIKGGRANLEIYRNFFSNRIVAHWNALPPQLKENQSLPCFKTRLREHLNR